MRFQFTVMSAGLSIALLSTPLLSGCKSDSDKDPNGASGGSGGSNIRGLGGQFGQGGSGPIDPNDCGGELVEADPRPANVLLLVDSSASMTGTPEGFEDTKWETLKDALGSALPEVQDLLGLGLKLYPAGSGVDSECSAGSGIDVGIGDGSSKTADILRALELTPGGATPTAAALQDALDYFENGAGKDREGEKFVLLATDGGPNCGADNSCACDDGSKVGASGDPTCGSPAMCTTNIDERDGCSTDGGNCCFDMGANFCLDDTGTDGAVQALAAAGIKTIVLGMPGSEAYAEVLDQLAVTGGLPASDTSPRYNKVTDAVGLENALRDVTRDVVRTCEIQLGATPPDLSKVNVFLEGEVIGKDDDDGWKFDESTDPPTITLTGPTCEKVERQGVEKIQVTFGCDTFVPR